jgi:hypothetical protein
MNEINNICVSRYKPDDNTIQCEANNWPRNPQQHMTEEDMADWNPGDLPPHLLSLKEGCVLMLLRNWRLSDGNHNSLLFASV